jgi:hypothetical protein
MGIAGRILELITTPCQVGVIICHILTESTRATLAAGLADAAWLIELSRLICP